MKHFITILLATFLFGSCKNADQNKLIGIWQNGSDWFDIAPKNVYSTGTGPMTSYTNLKYDLDEAKHQLTFYTNVSGNTFYMQYKLIGNDSLQLQNSLPNSLPIVFYKTKQRPSSF
jgi:hypothetical protein